MTDSGPAARRQSSASRRRARTTKNLNEEQLLNKRLVDRKAQRAFRQRSKDCMTNLTALQEVCSQKDEEIEKLRRRNAELLKHLRAICQSVSGVAQMLEEDREPGDAIVDASPESRGLIESDRFPDNLREGTRDQSVGEPLVPPLSPVERPPPTQLFVQAAQLTANDGLSKSPYPHLTALHDLTGLRHRNLEFPAPQPSSYEQHHATPSHPPVAGGYDELSLQDSSPRELFPDPQESTCRRSMVSRVLPAHSVPTCPLDHILTDFRQSRFEQVARGLPLNEVVGPQTAVVSELFGQGHVEGTSPLSSMLSQVLSTFPHPKITEKLAFFCLMYQTMRWLVSPAKETYDSVPPWLRPTVTQITVPHAPWIDNIPWPAVRDMLIEHPEEYPFETFSENYSEYVRVSWPFDSHDAVSTVNGDLILHSIFLKHVRDLDNWTVAPQFLERYPGMSRAINSRREP